MSDNRKIYVVDTNILIDSPNLIPILGEPRQEPENPTLDLSGAHIVIPTAVVRELSSFKTEQSERGKTARDVLKRIRALFEGNVPTMAEAYGLDGRAQVTCNGQAFSVLPVNSDFKASLPFRPSEDDMDGQIILAALSVAFIQSGIPTDGSKSLDHLYGTNAPAIRADGVTLLTNDNGLAIRARERGLTTSRYEHQYTEPYTGRREVVVPNEVFDEFMKERALSREMFEAFMPDEPRLVANEFVVMRVADFEAYTEDFSSEKLDELDTRFSYFHHVGRYDVDEDAVVGLKYATKFPVPPKNVGQAIYAEALMGKRFAAVICTGPAGAGKTYMPTIYGYEACLDGKYLGITVVPCETHGKLGTLPGDLNEKMSLDVAPLKNALRNYLLTENASFKKEWEQQRKEGLRGRLDQIAKKGEDGEEERPTSLQVKLEKQINYYWQLFFSNIPIEKARGRDFAYELVLYDEFQDQNISQADTLIKRIGRDGKIVITGDVHQIHAPYLDTGNNGLVYASSLLYDNPYVAQVCFTEEEVVRHPLVMMIAKRQKELDKVRRREAEDA